MNKLTDNDLREALKRREAKRTKADVPDDFCDNIMQEIAPKTARRRKTAYMAALAVAASVVTALIFVWQDQGSEMKDKPVAIVQKDIITKPLYDHYKDSVSQQQSLCKTTTKPLYRKKNRKKNKKNEEPPCPPKNPPSEGWVDYSATDDQLHYASQTDTAYQDPARVDDFITKFANYYHVKQAELECSVPQNSNVVSMVYVFSDKKEIDVFGRLLQVACWYSDETPGYHLNFSHRQFFFELKDIRKQLQYRWIAERMNGKILLYSTCSPIDTNVSSACYQEYRDELMHTKSIHSKPKEI